MARSSKSLDDGRNVQFFEKNTKIEISNDGLGFSGTDRTEKGIEPVPSLVKRASARPVEAFSQDIYKPSGVWA